MQASIRRSLAQLAPTHRLLSHDLPTSPADDRAAMRAIARLQTIKLLATLCDSLNEVSQGSRCVVHVAKVLHACAVFPVVRLEAP